MTEKERKIEKFFSYGSPVIVAIDHGQYFGPIEGIESLRKTILKIYNADGILMTPFVFSYIRDFFNSLSSPLVMLRVNWTTALCMPWNYKQAHTNLVIEPEEASFSGADAIIANLTLQSGSEKVDSKNVKVFTEIAKKKEKVGIPLIGEIIPLIPSNEKEKLHTHIKQAVRIAWELGADMIKTIYTGENFNEIIEGVPIPVFILGGDKMKYEEDALSIAKEGAEKGAKGIVFGRNVFQSENPTKFIEQLKATINGNKYSQLKMHLYDNNNLCCDIKLPDGYKIKTFKEGNEKIWCEIINKTIGGNLNKEYFEEKFKSKKQFDPEGVFFLYYGDKPCGTVIAWKEDRNLGQLHYLGVLPEHSGKNLGYILCSEVLKYFQKRRINQVFLTTDDFRLSAIKIYLKLGFKPVICEKDNIRRWGKILNYLKLQETK